MRVTIFSPYATVAPHFETELELAQRHLDAGDSVEFVSCLGQLANCDFNISRTPQRCQECRQRRENGLIRLTSAVGERELVPLMDSNSMELRTDFENVAELARYRWRGFDIGYAAYSSLVSAVRDPEPDLVEHRELLSRLLRSAWATFEYSMDYLNRNRPDRVYLFNGRFAAMRAVLRACQQTGVDCYIHERGCDQNHFALFPNHLPHDIEANVRTLRQAWSDASGDPDREAVGASWFEERVARVERNWISFVKSQEMGLLPEEWDPRCKNVAIFNSSDDEFVAIGDQWKQPLYSNQIDAVRRIANDAARATPDLRLYLRMHPNLANVDNRRKKEWLDLDFDNLVVIEPDSPVDTYTLLRQADQVVSFGSSAGIEAVYWGRPSILLGPSFYRSLGGTYQPADHRQLVSLLGQDLPPQERTPALMYGYWLQTRGEPYRYYESEDLFQGRFRGSPIVAEPPSLPRSWRQKLRRETTRLWSQLTGTE